VLTVRACWILGLLAEGALLAVLTALVGLGALGWAVGLGCGVGTNLLLARALSRAGEVGPRPADVVTLTRATLVGGVAALVAESFVQGVVVAVLVGIAAVALVLDAVDGQVARRRGTPSEVGARFDLEVDAFLILVLSCFVARDIGGWVLAIGAARYALLVAGWLVPWLRKPVPPRYWRKVVAAVQGIVLTVVAAAVMPVYVAEAVVAVALAMLIESFGRDVWWLARRHAAEARRGAARAPMVTAAHG
jgi:phosphatidylglycerophosphate synthase